MIPVARFLPFYFTRSPFWGTIAVALIVGTLGAFLSVKGYVQGASRQADLLPSRALGAHDLGINVGRFDFNAGIPEISWEPLLTELEPHDPRSMSALGQKRTSSG